MVRFCPLLVLCTQLAAVSVSLAQAVDPPKSAYDLLPKSVQAIVWLPLAEQTVEKWERTQLAKLAQLQEIKEFWESQRQEIEKRFTDAGWRLRIHPQDLSEISAGQIALAWLERPEDVLKPFSIALIVDIGDQQKKTNDLLDKIGKEIKDLKGESRKLAHKTQSITRYALPKQPGELRIQETYFSLLGDQLLCSDDLKTLQELIDSALAPGVSANSLSKDATFIEGRKQLAVTGKSHVEYFVRPLGFARVLRAISGKRSNSSTDILTVLQNQGFSALRCVCGEIDFGRTDYDIQHRGFVLSDKPLPKSAQVLDFPNAAKRDIPNWVSANASSVLATCWNAKTAFWKIEGLVDDMAGQEGVFREVINGIKTDPTGPQIDIEREVLPFLTNDIYSITDCKEPITTDSRRNIIALRISNTAKMTAVLRRAMENEPDAEEVKFEGQSIWKVSHPTDDAAISVDSKNDFGDFGAKPVGKAAPNPNDDEQPWLSNWAITVHGNYLIFASHVELIKEALAQSKVAKVSPLTVQADYVRAQDALIANFGTDPGSFWQIDRSDRSYRMQYELFREGKLQQSQSMLSSILDRLLQKKSELKSTGQKVSGKGLPEFEKIRPYLQPAGMMIHSKEKGWSFGGLLLAAPTQPSELNVEEKSTGTASALQQESSKTR